jgi:ATP synthase F1 delta subunit
MVDMAVNKITGTVNLTNPGLITHNEILEMYREIVDPHFTWRNMTLDEQTLVLSAGRSNNYLDHKRLVELYPNVKHIKEAVRECLEKYPKPEKTIKIVIARYHEDISWVLPYKEHVIIYNKGHELNEPFPPQIFLPNVGRETHTYYHHIVENYNRLDDFTIFLQGHPFDHAHNCIEKIDDYLHKFKTMNLEFEYISQSILTTSLHGCPYHHGLPMRDVYNNIFGPHKNPNSDIVFGAGALFIVSKQSILRRPKQFYENDELSEFLISPLYSKNAKKEVLDKVFEPLLLNQNTKNFINLLIQRSRIDMISLIAQKYSNIINDLENIKLANVKTASPLSSEQEKQIIEHLKVKTGAKDIELFTIIDKTLLGGLKVEVSSMIIDVSLKGQLSQLASQLEITLF